MMSWKQILWHFVRLALAVVLLSWDTRVFLFYAFTILLMVLHRTDYVRAEVRVFQFANEIKLRALMKHLNVPDHVVKDVAEFEKEQTTVEQVKSLEADIRRLSIG